MQFVFFVPILFHLSSLFFVHGLDALSKINFPSLLRKKVVGNAAYQVIAADLLDNPVLSLANISHNPDAVSQLLYQ